MVDLVRKHKEEYLAKSVSDILIRGYSNLCVNIVLKE